MAKYGDGYNLAAAEMRNKNDMMIRIVIGKYFLMVVIFFYFYKYNKVNDT